MEWWNFELLLLDSGLLKPDFKILHWLKSYLVPVIVLPPEPEDVRNKILLDTGCCAYYIRPIRQDVLFPLFSIGHIGILKLNKLIWIFFDELIPGFAGMSFLIQRIAALQVMTVSDGNGIRFIEHF